MKVLTIVGARPQFIKAAAVSKAFIDQGQIEEVIVHTGQHYDTNMSDIFFQELGIPHPKYNLGIHGMTHGAMTGQMLEGIEAKLLDEKPQFVLVYGDTNSTLAGALAASKLHIPVAHIEAGLRSFNKKMPEEINRILTDHVSDLLFVPTEVAVNNLANEGISGDKVKIVGDVMYDATLLFTPVAEKKNTVFNSLEIAPESYILATVHRAENTDHPDRLKAIFEAFKRLSKQYEIVLPLHPRTKHRLEKFQIDTSGIRLIDPIGYLDMIVLEKNAALVATDSGGVQKEAFFHGTPCVTLRDETEWVELVELGWNTVVPPNKSEAILEAIEQQIVTKGEIASPYGRGNAANIVVDQIASFFM